MPTAIPDSSVIISLSVLGKLRLIRELNESVVVPTAVAREVIEEGRGQPGSEELQRAVDDGWVRLVQPKNEALVTALGASLGKGESEVIALGMELEDTVVLLDDKAARTNARRLLLRQTGIVGILLRAKRLGKIESISVELKKLREEAGFRLSEEILSRALAEGGE